MKAAEQTGVWAWAMHGAACAAALLLVAGGCLLVGCSSQDFGRPVGRVTDFVDSGQPYVEQPTEEEARRRAEHLGQLLMQWERVRRGDTQDYRVGTDDMLEISVLALEEPGKTTVLTRSVRTDGCIALPLIGDVVASGRTTAELESLVADTYRDGLIKDPHVVLKVAEYRSSPVVVTGAVGQPGVYYLRHNDSTVLEVLSMANGILPTAGKELIIVRSRVEEEADVESSPGIPRPPLRETPVTAPTASGPMLADAGLQPIEQDVESDPEGTDTDTEMINVDLEKLLVEGDTRLNATVQGGDILSVPPYRQSFFYVLGYVRSPGSFELKDRAGVGALQAVAMAGGLSPSARAQNSYVITERLGGRRVVAVDLTKIARGIRPPVNLRSGDTLIVGSGPLAKLGEFVKPSVGASASYSPVP